MHAQLANLTAGDRSHSVIMPSQPTSSNNPNGRRVKTISRKKTESNHGKGKAVWDRHTHETFLQLCITEKREGNMPTTHFNPQGWRNIVKNLFEMTGRDYDRIQCKNHWDVMKKDWQHWLNLVNKETCLGWDDTRSTVIADESWWAAKLQRFPECSKFRDKGLEHREIYEELFNGVVAVGDDAWVPPVGVHLEYNPNQNAQSAEEEDEEEEENDDDDDDDEEDEGDEALGEELGQALGDEDTQAEPEPRPEPEQAEVLRVRKRASGGGGGGGSRVRRGKKRSLALRMCQALDRVGAAIESKSGPALVSCSCKGVSIRYALDLLDSTPKVEKHDAMWVLATKLFAKPEHREMFYELGDPESRYVWLQGQLGSQDGHVSARRHP